MLGLKFDSKLNFDVHISEICIKRAGKLKALCGIGYLKGFEERKKLINSLSMQILIIVLLYGILALKNP